MNMEIIGEVLLKGDITERLKGIGRAIVDSLPKIQNEARGHILCDDSVGVEGVIISVADEADQAKTRFQYSSKAGLEFIIRRRKSWDKAEYLKWKQYYPEKDGSVTKRFIPSVIVNDSREAEELALEIGFYLVHRGLIGTYELLKLFEQYIQMTFRKTFNKIESSEELLDLLPKIINRWILAKHAQGFKHHIGIYIQNILRKRKLKDFSELTVRRKKYEKEIQHLYYLNSSGKIRLKRESKGFGIFKFNSQLLAKAERAISRKQEKSRLAKSYAKLRGVSYKSAQRRIQRELKKGLSLQKIHNLIAKL